MTAAVHTFGRRFLPRGWKDLGVQVAIWFGFLGIYQLVRGIGDRDPTLAFQNGLRVIGWEERVSDLFEVTFQHAVSGSRFLTDAVSYTYWNSEFTVVALTLLWVYLRRHEHFRRFRNWILVANGIGLVGYIAMPTAPPRMFPTFGFDDVLARFGGLNHGSGLIELAANPYAAMPSLHAADALIVGITMATVCKRWWIRGLWLLWPSWVWFSVMATGNHFWLDCVAGVAVAVISAIILQRGRLIRPGPVEASG